MIRMAKFRRNIVNYIGFRIYDLIYSDPVPGACNQEFPMEYDPNVILSHNPNIASMKYQYSNGGFPRVPDSSSEPDCESQWDAITYDIYLYYMPSTNPNYAEHYTAIKRMTHPADIEKFGKKVSLVSRGCGSTSYGWF